MLSVQRCRCIKCWSVTRLHMLRPRALRAAKPYGGIDMPYHAINVKIGPTDAVAQVRRYYCLSANTPTCPRIVESPRIGMPAKHPQIVVSSNCLVRE